MNKVDIMQSAGELFKRCPGNIVSKEEAICDEVVGLELYESPLICFGSAKDELFQKYKEEDVIGPWHMLPEEWLSGAKTVISFFFPFSEKIKEDTRKFINGPSPAWLHGRIEGQRYLNTYMALFKEWFENRGVKCCVPAIDPRFKSVEAGNRWKEYDCVNEHTFGSNWSERHAAFVCGLGTFGLSKGLITEKGIAGRFTSMIIDLEVEPDERKYTDPYEYCTKCGACVFRCPVDAITIMNGKNHNICSDWLKKMGQKYAPRYGCGLCQTKVPCESRRPQAIKGGILK